MERIYALARGKRTKRVRQAEKIFDKYEDSIMGTDVYKKDRKNADIARRNVPPVTDDNRDWTPSEIKRLERNSKMTDRLYNRKYTGYNTTAAKAAGGKG